MRRDRKTEVVDPSILGSLLRYEPETGKLFWLPRPVEMFAEGGHSVEHNCRKWNARYANQEALFALHDRGYLTGTLLGQKCFAHRVIWALQTGKWPDAEIDHINGKRSDNRWINLREATSAENKRNRHCVDGVSSRFRGVSWATREGKWQACIQTAGKKVHLGYFLDETTAARAYDESARRLHGAFASVNFAEAA